MLATGTFTEELFSVTGNVLFANLAAAREFAQRMNRARDAEHHPERAVHPGALNAMGLIDEALHLIVALYRERRDPKAMLDALAWFEPRLGRERLERTLLGFADSSRRKQCIGANKLRPVAGRFYRRYTSSCRGSRRTDDAMAR